MEHRQLGTTDIHIPVICLGTMTWGIQNTEAEAHEQLDYALSQGINFIDTAEIYPVPPDPSVQGRTEAYLGTWLAKRGKHDDLIIASKVACRKQRSNFQTRTVTNLSRADIREAIEGSLSRLQTDYLDLYQIHAPDRPANHWGIRGITEIPDDTGAASIEETYGALVELIKEGKIRHIGLSNETPWGVMQFQRLAEKNDWPPVVSIQNQYSLTNRTYELGLSEVSFREHIGLLAYSPLSGGALTGKYLGGKMPAGARFTLSDRNRRYNAPEVQAAIQAYVNVAEKHGLDPSQMALAFVVSRQFVTSCIIGATTMDQLKIDIAAGDLTLAPEVLADIEEVYRQMPDLTA